MVYQSSYLPTISHISRTACALLAMLNVVFWYSLIDVSYHHVEQPVEVSTHPVSSEPLLQIVRLNVHLFLAVLCYKPA